jgi:hypothetical protein
MHCNALVDPLCLLGPVVQSAGGSVAGGIAGEIAAAITAGVRWIVVNTATWWIQASSPDLAGEPAVDRMQQWLLPVTAAVAVAGVIAAGARMAISRRANPLLDVTGGLVTLAAAVTLGTIVPALLLRAGDSWSAWVLQVSTGGHFAPRLVAVLTLTGSGAAPVVVLILGVIAMVLSIVQAVLMLFRQAALIILAGVLPLAAAGSAAPMTRPWIRKVTAWMLALIFYKPAAAAVYATAFTMIGSGRSARTILMGFVMLLLSLIALPALMRFFTWTTGTIAGPGGGGQLLGAAAMGAVAVGSMRSSSGGGAQGQAAFMTSRLGSPPGGEAPAGATPGGGGSPAGSEGSAGTSAGSADDAGAEDGGLDGGSGGAPSGAGSGGSASAPPTASGAASAPTGAGDGTAPNPAGENMPGAAGAGSAPPAAPAGARTAGAAAGAPAVGAAAGAAMQAASAASQLAAGAMEPEDQP